MQSENAHNGHSWALKRRWYDLLSAPTLFRHLACFLQSFSLSRLAFQTLSSSLKPLSPLVSLQKNLSLSNQNPPQLPSGSFLLKQNLLPPNISPATFAEQTRSSTMPWRFSCHASAADCLQKRTLPIHPLIHVLPKIGKVVKNAP